MNNKIYKFEAEMKKVPEIDGAYSEFPYDIRRQIGKQPGDTVFVTIRERE